MISFDFIIYIFLFYSYTIVAYIPGVTSKNQLSVGMDDEKLLVIEVEGSFCDSDNNKYGKLIRSSWPLRFDIKIPIPTM